MTDSERQQVNEMIYDYLLPDTMDGLLDAESIAESALDDLNAAVDSTVMVEPTAVGMSILENEDEFKRLVKQAFIALTKAEN